MTYINSSTCSSSDIAQSLYGKSSSQSGIAGNDSATAALQTAEKRIGVDVGKTTTLLSSVGKLKSAVADTQSAAQSLSNFSATTTADEMKAGITKFVTAFNNTVAASSNVSTSSGGSDLRGAGGVGQDLKRAVGTDIEMADTLRKWGVTVQSDGQLAFDEDKFDAQHASDNDGVSVFQKLGETIDGVATKELGSNGAVGHSLNSLNKRTDLLKSQQDTLIKALTDSSSDSDSDSDSDKKSTDATGAINAANSQKNSLFDILQADSSDDTDTSTQNGSAALKSYLSVLNQQ